jgi:hypothetical protein
VRNSRNHPPLVKYSVKYFSDVNFQERTHRFQCIRFFGRLIDAPA